MSYLVVSAIWLVFCCKLDICTSRHVRVFAAKGEGAIRRQIGLNFENFSKSTYSYVYGFLFPLDIFILWKKCFFVVMTSQCRVLTTVHVHICWLFAIFYSFSLSFFTKKVPAHSCPNEIFCQSNNINKKHLMLKYLHGAKLRSYWILIKNLLKTGIKVLKLSSVFHINRLTRNNCIF